MPNPQRFCIFCSRPGLSREHVWPLWAHQHVPHGRSRKHNRTVFKTSKSNPNIVGLHHRKVHSGDVLTIKLRVVCKTHCNNGWMSALETRVKPILLPLIVGAPAVLDANDQRIIATWATMKFMVSEFSLDAEEVVSNADERSYLMGRQEPPANWKVWIAHHKGNWHSTFFRQSSIMGFGNDGGPTLPPGGLYVKNTQSMIIGIGQLVISALSTRVPELQMDVPPNEREIIRRIWPPQGTFLWPPGRFLDDDGARRLATAFQRFCSQLPWTPGPGGGSV